MGELVFIFNKAFQLFLVLDPIGNFAIIASLISGFDIKRQRTILYREITFSLIIMIFIYWMGGYLLLALNISQAAITITGGIIFFLFAISLLFPGSGMVSLKNLEEEPFIVPIAIPLVVGPSSIATIIMFSYQKDLWLYYMAVILIAWIASSVIITLGPFLVRLLGKTGLAVLERFVGLICSLIALKMLLMGFNLFLLSVNN